MCTAAAQSSFAASANTASTAYITSSREQARRATGSRDGARGADDQRRAAADVDAGSAVAVADHAAK